MFSYLFFHSSKYIKIVLYLIVFKCLTSAHAGSYDQFFIGIKQNDTSTISILLNLGFNPNTLSPNSDPPLHLALQLGNFDIVNLLLKTKDLSINALNPHDESALMLASLRGNSNIVRKLVFLGSDINKTGWTPLHYASTNGSIDIIEFLLENHAFIDSQSPNGTTPLMMAAKYGNDLAVEKLLIAGADPTILNEQFLTAADFAISANKTQSANLIAKFLRSSKGSGNW